MIPPGIPPRDEWLSYPMSCQTFADIAGASYNCEVVQTAGRFRYCKAHFLDADNLKRLAQGGPCILITHSSDWPGTTEIAESLPRNVTRWFANHVATDHALVESIPVGFRFSQDILTALLAQARTGRPERRGLLYMNHTRSHPAYHGVRDGIWEHFEPFSWVKRSPRLPVAAFYADVAAHDYLLAPPGAYAGEGHQPWEAMALGTIPVMFKSRATAYLSDLPVLQVGSWAEVTEERLMAEYPALRARFDTEAMRRTSMLYWRQRIESCLPS